MENIIQQLQEQVQQLNVALNNQQAHSHQLQQQLQELQAAPPPFQQEAPAQAPQVTVTNPTRRIPEPEAFDGRRDQYYYWKIKVVTYITINNHIYEDDRAKVLYVLNRLTGRAFQQVCSIVDLAIHNNPAPELDNLAMTLEKLDGLFGQVNRTEEAAARLDALRQKPNEAVAEYASEFQRLLSIIGSTEANTTLCVRFKNGL